MAPYIVKRLMAAVVQAAVVLVITFTLVRLTPGDPVDAYLSRVQSEATASPSYIAAIRHELALDQPFPVQFWRYVLRVVRGNLGVSYTESQPVLHVIGDQLPYTIELALASVLIAVSVGIPLGVYAGLHRGQRLDYLATAAATVGYSLPRFWIGMILIVVFAVWLGWLPVVGVGAPGDVPDILYHLVLPACALGLAEAAYIARMSRSAVLEVLGEDYVRTARAKGIAEWVVLARHTFRNAIIPIATVVGLTLGRALGGSAVIETLFGRVGIGSMIVLSVTERDYALVQGAVLIFAVGVFVVNLAVDLGYAWLNPRIRFT